MKKHCVYIPPSTKSILHLRVLVHKKTKLAQNFWQQLLHFLDSDKFRFLSIVSNFVILANFCHPLYNYNTKKRSHDTFKKQHKKFNEKDNL